MNSTEKIEKIEKIEYSQKSFVLTGDNTKKYKEDIKSLGGKWNSNLTNKETGEKFKGWIFPKTLEYKVDAWLNNGTLEKKEKHTSKREKDDSRYIQSLLDRISVLEKDISDIKSFLAIKQTRNISVKEEDYEEGEVGEVHKRLLK